MPDRREKTSIVFPRVNSRDGPAMTFHKEEFFDPNKANPLSNSLAQGFSDETTYAQGNRRTMITLVPPVFSAQEARNRQRFMSNFKKPDEATRRLIRSRRPV